jgi:hypothetical protein
MLASPLPAQVWQDQIAIRAAGTNVDFELLGRSGTSFPQGFSLLARWHVSGAEGD